MSIDAPERLLSSRELTPALMYPGQYAHCPRCGGPRTIVSALCRRCRFADHDALMVDRLLEKLNLMPDGCWHWTGTLNPGGYGMVRWHQKMRLAHRIVYELLTGPIPDGLHIDHLCRVRHCVNPAHLEPVTMAENSRRGNNAQRDKTHCPYGHPYDDQNTGHYRGHRYCRACNARRAREKYAREKAA